MTQKYLEFLTAASISSILGRGYVHVHILFVTSFSLQNSLHM